MGAFDETRVRPADDVNIARTGDIADPIRTGAAGGAKESFGSEGKLPDAMDVGNRHAPRS